MATRAPSHCKASSASKPAAQSPLPSAPQPAPRIERSWSLKFRPWFVDKAFWKWHEIYHLSGMDGVCLKVDVCINSTVALLLVPAFSWSQLVCLLSATVNLLLAMMHAAKPDFYMRHRIALHTFRRLQILYHIRMVMAHKQSHSSSIWMIVVWHMLMQTGAMGIGALSLFFMEPWPIAAAHAVVGVLIMGSTCVPACRGLLSRPQPAAAAWQVIWLLDKAAAGVYRRSLSQPQMAAAACHTAVNTLQVLFACASVCGVYWIERWSRLRYKAQLPPSVAAMQPHIYNVPWFFGLTQVLLLVLYPTLVVTWVIAGFWHGL